MALGKYFEDILLDFEKRLSLEEHSSLTAQGRNFLRSDINEQIAKVAALRSEIERLEKIANDPKFDLALQCSQLKGELFKSKEIWEQEKSDLNGKLEHLTKYSSARDKEYRKLQTQIQELSKHREECAKLRRENGEKDKEISYLNNVINQSIKGIKRHCPKST